MKLALFSTVGSALLLQAAERPVSKVVKLLNDMKTELEADAKDDKEVYEKLSCWCRTNTKEKTTLIATTEKEIGRLKASIAEDYGLIKELEAKKDAQYSKFSFSNSFGWFRAFVDRQTSGVRNFRPQRNAGVWTRCRDGVAATLNPLQALHIEVTLSVGESFTF